MLKLRRFILVCAVAIAPIGWANAQGTTDRNPPQASYEPEVGQQGKDVVWVPTPQALVDRMLEMADITDEDYVVDLGSGDGRTVISVARLGARAHGIEYNPDLVELSQRNAEAAGVSDRATFEEADIFASDFTDADVVTLFLLPDLNIRLRPTLLDMKPGTRVVSNSFNMGDWQPDDQIDAGSDCENYCRAYKWIIPAKLAGEWSLDDSRLFLTQTYQMLTGTLVDGETRHDISDAKVTGNMVVFTAGGTTYQGTVDGNTISGTFEDGTIWNASRSAG